MNVLEGTTDVADHHVTNAKLSGGMTWLECPSCHQCPPFPSVGSEPCRLTAIGSAASCHAKAVRSRLADDGTNSAATVGWAALRQPSTAAAVSGGKRLAKGYNPRSFRGLSAMSLVRLS